MKEETQMKYKLAAFADEADGQLSEQIKAMTENGISYLEIRGVNGENISELTKEKAKEVYEKLEASGIKVWSLGSPFGKIGIGDDFESHLDSFKRGIELASILQAKNIRMFSFYVPSGEKKRYEEEVMRRLKKMVEAAKGSGVLLCHENEKGIYGDIAKDCLTIHQNFPSLRAVFDPANFIQCGQDTMEAWTMLSPYVEYMHIKDALKDGSVVPAGKGIGNLPYLLSQYKGEVLTLEPHLSVFDGFEKLEDKEKTKMNYCYPTARAAFDAAVSALKELL